MFFNPWSWFECFLLTDVMSETLTGGGLKWNLIHAGFRSLRLGLLKQEKNPISPNLKSLIAYISILKSPPMTLQQLAKKKCKEYSSENSSFNKNLPLSAIHRVKIPKLNMFNTKECVWSWILATQWCKTRLT